MQNWTEQLKSAVRPFIIIWGFVVYGVSVINGIEVPELLVGLITGVIIEYFGERAVKRVKEQK